MKEIYQRFSGRFALPGNSKYMSLTEFMEMFLDSGIFNENFGYKQLPVQFSTSMMTQVDELDSERHMNMTFAEFCEAFVRVADQTTIPSLVDDTYTSDQILDGLVTDADKSEYGKRSVPQKIESL
jgi:hypothetical protein